MVHQLKCCTVVGAEDASAWFTSSFTEAFSNKNTVSFIDAMNVVEVEIALIGDQIGPSLTTIRGLPQLCTVPSHWRIITQDLRSEDHLLAIYNADVFVQFEMLFASNLNLALS